MTFKILYFLLATTSTINAYQKAIYGSDDRFNLFEIQDKFLIQAARASAIMVDSETLVLKNNVYRYEPSPLKERLPLCPEEKFLQEPSLGKCSGFLIAPDILVTAGHCLGSKYDCKKAKWVFDFSYQTPYTDLRILPKKNIYQCKELLDKEENAHTFMDYSIIQLDRNVEGITPLKLSNTSKIKVGTELITIGHPAGLPTKVNTRAYVTESKHSHYFVADIDAFQGSSGSAVLNADSLQVEGILVRGEKDYVRDEDRKCLKLYHCNSIEECRGEDVIRIKSIKGILRY
jgi:hypothetical protein